MAEAFNVNQGGQFSESTAWRALAGRLWGGGDRPEWQQEAACGDQPEAFFADTGRGLDWTRKVEQARAVCHGCPVLVECLRDVIGWESRTATVARDPRGVVGGMTGGERRELYERMTGSVGVSGKGKRRNPRRR
ncbi:WhiB family transcriptional regulator [Saccharopolyspora sp. NPDC002376]